MQKLPLEAFEYYVSLGAQRGYQAVADRYCVTKRAVVDHARSENWVERLESIEKEARQRSEQRLVETIEEQRTRHLKTLRALHGRAIEALRNHPIASCWEAARVIELVIKWERILAGEAKDGSSVAAALEQEARRQVIRDELRAMLDSVPDVTAPGTQE